MDWEKLIADLAPWIIAGGTIVLNYLEHRHKQTVDMQSDMMAQYNRVVKERDAAQSKIAELEAELEKKDGEIKDKDRVIDEIVRRRAPRAGGESESSR